VRTRHDTRGLGAGSVLLGAGALASLAALLAAAVLWVLPAALERSPTLYAWHTGLREALGSAPVDRAQRALSKADCAHPEHGAAAKGARLNLPPAPAYGDEIVLAAVGDVLLHTSLLRQGMSTSFDTLWDEIAPILSKADIAYANLEGPIAPGVDRYGRLREDVPQSYDGEVYTGYPLFNYPPGVAEALVRAGVDIVSTANNHSLDRFSLGADLTLAALEAAGLPGTGTLSAAAAKARSLPKAPTEPRPKPADLSAAPAQEEVSEAFERIVPVQGRRFAFLACTYGTNGIADRHGQVLLCFQDRAEVLGIIRRLSADESIDAVVFTPHWGREYSHIPDAAQTRLAQEAAEAGAALIIGAHPHVLQPWRVLETGDGRRVPVIYSLGNFVSGQRFLSRRTSVIALFGFVPSENGKLRVAGARHIPIYTERTPDRAATLLRFVEDLGASGHAARLHVADHLHPDHLLPIALAKARPLSTLTPCPRPALVPMAMIDTMRRAMR